MTKKCFVKVVSFSVILVVQNLSLIYALSFKSKMDILIKILLSVQFKHKTMKVKKHLLNALILKIILLVEINAMQKIQY